MRQKRLAVILVGVMVFIALVSLGAKAVSSYAAQNKVHPLQYFPLAVGNSWTYVWENKKGVYEDNKVYSKILSLNFFMSDAQLVINGSDYELYEPVTVRETYTIGQLVVTKNKDQLYSFTMSCSGPQCKDHRFGDGRFYYADFQYWCWFLSDMSPKAVVLLQESILSRRYPDYQAGADYPRDARQLMRFTSNYMKWNYSNNKEYLNQFVSIEMDFSDHSVTVPAGKFEHCIMSKEIYTWFSEKYFVYRFFAPGVGKVKEYQELEDGTITYVMSLEKYNLVK